MSDVDTRLRQFFPFWARIEERFGHQTAFAVLAALLAVLLVAAVLATTALSRSDGGRELVVGRATATTEVAPQPTSAPSTPTSPGQVPVLPPPAPPVTAAAPPRIPPVTAAPLPPATRATPAGRPAPAPTAPPAPPPPSPTTTAVPVCAPADLDLQTSGEGDPKPEGPLVIHTSAKNVSGRPCNVTNSCRHRRLTIEDQSGALLYDSAVANKGGDCPLINEVPRTLLPGESLKDRYVWDRRQCTTGACPGPAVSPGSYLAKGHWEQGVAKPATVQIPPASS